MTFALRPPWHSDGPGCPFDGSGEEDVDRGRLHSGEGGSLRSVHLDIGCSSLVRSRRCQYKRPASPRSSNSPAAAPTGSAIKGKIML